MEVTVCAIIFMLAPTHTQTHVMYRYISVHTHTYVHIHAYVCTYTYQENYIRYYLNSYNIMILIGSIPALEDIILYKTEHISL